VRIHDTTHALDSRVLECVGVCVVVRVAEWCIVCCRALQSVAECCSCCRVVLYTWMRHITHRNASFHTCKWVMSHTCLRHVTHVNELRVSACITPHAWMNHVTCMSEPRCTYEYITAHMWMCHVTRSHMYEWVMSHVRMSHITQVNELYHTCEWVMSHARMSHVTHANESCRACEWVMSHIWMNHGTHVDLSVYTHMNESFTCHTDGQGNAFIHVCSLTNPHGIDTNEPCHTHTNESLSHIWMCHVTHMNETCHTDGPGNTTLCDSHHMSHVWVMSHVIVWYYLVHLCDVSHSYVWHDSYICAPWLIHICDRTLWLAQCDSHDTEL